MKSARSLAAAPRPTLPLLPLAFQTRNAAGSSLLRTMNAAHFASISSSTPLSSRLSFEAKRQLHYSIPIKQEAQDSPEVPASAPSYIVPESFAVVYIGGRQYKVTRGDQIITERLLADVGEKIHLKKVLLVGSQNFTAIGTPLLTEAVVEATVEEQTRAAKVVVFKFKRRKNHRRTRGHRQDITVLRIGDVKLAYEQAAPDAATGRSALFGPTVPAPRLLPVRVADNDVETLLS